MNIGANSNRINMAEKVFLNDKLVDIGPQAEWSETITKARALLAGIKAVQNNQEEKA